MGRTNLRYDSEFGSDEEANKRIRRALEATVRGVGQTESDGVISDAEYKQNKRLIELAKNSNLLQDVMTRTRAKRGLLKQFGYSETTKDDGITRVSIDKASAVDVHYQLMAIYYSSERENQLYDQKHGASH
ncbi:MAG: hypothetical protein AABW63_00505 [Nanoarchaeota archaeon]